MRSGAEGSRGPGDLGFEPTEAERRTQVQILSLRLLGRGAENFRNKVFGVFFRSFSRMPRNSCCEMRVTQCMTCLTNSNQSQHTDTVLTQAPPVSINMPITFIIFHILHLIASSWSFFTLLEHYGVIFYNVKKYPDGKHLSLQL